MDGCGPRLLAVSDLHIAYPENREIVRKLAPERDGDWLLVAGDVTETVSGVDWALGELSSRFEQVIWAPGNHELWTPPGDPVQIRGEQRYEHLVELCRARGIVTPEDPYPVWQSASGPVTVAPLFLLYDYSFRPAGTFSKEQALAAAHAAGVVCTDEYLLSPDPYGSREEWCRQRVEQTSRRLAELGGAPTVLVSHWPLVRQPTQVLRFPEFALWCGTDLTADWHLRFHAVAAVYGHLHIPRSTRYDGVPFEEVSVGYPREWQRQSQRAGWLREILPGAY